MKFAIALVSAGLVAGCSSGVNIKHVGADGQLLAGEDGFYVPRMMPYLLVADLPDGPAGQTQNPASSITGSDPSDKNNAKAAAPAASAPATTSSDQSFQVLTRRYTMKLIYLPDFSHQQSLQVSAQGFGKASMQLTLANDALVSFIANSDKTENGEVAKAAISDIITAATGGIGGVGAAVANVTKSPSPTIQIRKETSYSDPKCVQSFENPTIPPDVQAVCNTLEKEINREGEKDKQIKSLQVKIDSSDYKQAARSAPIDNTVLAPGLYQFQYNKNGLFSGLYPVASFGRNGHFETCVSSSEYPATPNNNPRFKSSDSACTEPYGYLSPQKPTSH